MEKAIKILKAILDAEARESITDPHYTKIMEYITELMDNDPEAIKDAIAEAGEPLCVSPLNFRIEYHHAEGEAPYARPLLKIYDRRIFPHPLVARIGLNDFATVAQELFERHLQSNLGLGRMGAEFGQRIKVLRKALGCV